MNLVHGRQKLLVCLLEIEGVMWYSTIKAPKDLSGKEYTGILYERMEKNSHLGKEGRSFLG